MVGRWQVESHEQANIPYALADEQKSAGNIYRPADTLDLTLPLLTGEARLGNRFDQFAGRFVAVDAGRDVRLGNDAGEPT